MCSVIRLCFFWFCLVAVTHSSVQAVNGSAKRQWVWANANESIDEVDADLTPRVGDIIYKEIAIVPIQSNSSCREDIDDIIRHIPSIDNEMSYETIYYNGSKTYTLFQVKELTECNINSEKRVSLQRRRKSIRKRKETKSKKLNFKPALAPSSPQVASALVSCGAQCPWQCNGILVGRQHVLTSAHCLYKKSPLKVKIGFLGRGGSVEWYSSDRFYIPRQWLVLKKQGKQSSTETMYDYALIRLMHPTSRPSITMRPAATIEGIDRVNFWGFDNSYNVYQSTCKPLTKPYGIQLKYCNKVTDNAGSGILAGNAWSGQVLVGVLSGYERGLGQDIYIGAPLTQKKILQINNWIIQY